MYTHLYTVMLRSHVCLSPNPFYPSTNPSPLPSPLRSLLPSTMPLRLHAPSGPSPFPPPLVTSPFSFFSPLPPTRFPSPGLTPATSTYSSIPQPPPHQPQLPPATAPHSTHYRQSRHGSCLFAHLTAAIDRFLAFNPSVKMKHKETFALNADLQQLMRLTCSTSSAMRPFPSPISFGPSRRLASAGLLQRPAILFLLQIMVSP